VVTDESNLKSGCAEEEEGSDDGDGEYCGVESAGKTEVDVVNAVVARRQSGSKRSSNGTSALVCALTSKDGDCKESTNEEDVQDDGNECEETDAAQEAGQEDCKDHVESSSATDSFNCLLPCRDVGVMVRKDGKEVGVDPENDSSAAEFQEVKGCLREPKRASTESTHYFERGC